MGRSTGLKPYHFSLIFFLSYFTWPQALSVYYCGLEKNMCTCKYESSGSFSKRESVCAEKLNSFLSLFPFLYPPFVCMYLCVWMLVVWCSAKNQWSEDMGLVLALFLTSMYFLLWVLLSPFVKWWHWSRIFWGLFTTSYTTEFQQREDCLGKYSWGCWEGASS